MVNNLYDTNAGLVETCITKITATIDPINSQKQQSQNSIVRNKTTSSTDLNGILQKNFTDSESKSGSQSIENNSAAIFHLSKPINPSNLLNYRALNNRGLHSISTKNREKSLSINNTNEFYDRNVQILFEFDLPRPSPIALNQNKFRTSNGEKTIKNNANYSLRNQLYTLEKSNGLNKKDDINVNTFISESINARVNKNCLLQPYCVQLSQVQVNVLTGITNTSNKTTSTLYDIDEQVNQQKINSNNTNNPLILRLSSMSATLKSSFIRPKISKSIDFSLFNKKIPNNQINIISKPNSNASPNESNYKLDLYSHKPKIYLQGRNLKHDDTANSLIQELNRKIEKIISNNVLIDSLTSRPKSTIKLKSENQIENASISKTTCIDSRESCFSSSSAVTNASLISTLSTTTTTTCECKTPTVTIKKLESPSIKDSSCNSIKLTTQTHQKAFLIANGGSSQPSSATSTRFNNSCTESLETIEKSTNLTSGLSKKPKHQASKWTCMICLSKHSLDINICTICGSSLSLQTQELAFPKGPLHLSEKFTKYTHKNLTIPVPKSNALQSIVNKNTSSSVLTILDNCRLNMWKCLFCTYINDSLKVVCMNCRSSKLQQCQNQSLSNENEKQSRMAHVSLQAKRTRGSLTEMNANFEANKINLNTSNEENEPAEGKTTNNTVERSEESDKDNFTDKDSKRIKYNDQICSNCKSDLNICTSNSIIKPSICFSNNPTPKRPPYFEEQIPFHKNKLDTPIHLAKS
jgi:hypothetical protein